MRNTPYLQARIKQSLRILPPVAAPIPKTAFPGDDVIDGNFVPVGTYIYNGWGLLRNTAGEVTGDG